MVIVAHIYASKAKINSGDKMIGIAYKQYFKETYLNNNECKFVDLDCRNSKLFDDNNISKLNTYDYIIVGGGGLILPDSGRNRISCWQWIISKENIQKIKKPIYVLSIGYNLFFKQNINMPRNNNKQDKGRINIFKENMTTLINKSTVFTMRHNDDVEKLINIVGEQYRDKIKYEMCHTVWYVNKFWKPKIDPQNQKYIAIEIKDDRQRRRYYKIGKENYYNKLAELVISYQKQNKPICYLSHDGSKDFYNYLVGKNIKIPYFSNCKAKEADILNNYSKIHTIYCSAGHSQMMSYGLGIKIISLVTHPKIKNFCDDIGDTNYIDVNNDIDKIFK